jgi:hypothetical protein
MTNPAVKPVPAAKLPADAIMQQLGYRVVPKRQAQVAQPRQVQEDVRKSGNGRAINDFDGFMSSVRVVQVKHTRSATAKLQDAAARHGARTEFKS